MDLHNNITLNDYNLEDDGVYSLGELELQRKQLKDILLKIEAYAFQRLTQRLLRESEFIQVNVTGRTVDGGEDGKGILSINGILSLHIIFM